MALPKKKIYLNKEQFEFFDGFMMGDGHIEPNGCFRIDVKHREFAEYILNMIGVNVKTKTATHKYHGKIYKSCLATKMNILFREERARWYNANKKIVPEDARITPNSIKMLYLCDGQLLKNGGIVISTNNFVKEDVNRLAVFLNNKGINCWIRKNNSLFISAKNKNTFLEMIGLCPVICYSYKWNYSETTSDIIEVRKRQAKIHIGKKLTKKHRDKIGRSLENFNIDNEKNKEAFVVLKNGEVIGEWKSMSRCAESLGIRLSGISMCLGGKQKTSGGYTFIFKRQ